MARGSGHEGCSCDVGWGSKNWTFLQVLGIIIRWSNYSDAHETTLDRLIGPTSRIGRVTLSIVCSY